MLYLIREQEHAVNKDTKEINDPIYSYVNGSFDDLVKYINEAYINPDENEEVDEEIKESWMNVLNNLKKSKSAGGWLDKWDGNISNERRYSCDSYITTQQYLSISIVTKKDLDRILESLKRKDEEIKYQIKLITTAIGEIK